MDVNADAEDWGELLSSFQCKLLRLGNADHFEEAPQPLYEPPSFSSLSTQPITSNKSKIRSDGAMKLGQNKVSKYQPDLSFDDMEEPTQENGELFVS